MNLGELIELLEAHNRERVVPLGLGKPMSYRGFYEELAFPPEEDITVGEMLDNAKSALGATFEGYKGGRYTMREHTPCWLADYGRLGEGIGPILMAYMLGDISGD